VNAYRHILVAADFSDLGRAAARRGRLEARLHGARLGFVHVIEHFPVVVPEHWVAPEDIDPERYYREQAARELAKLAGELGCGDAPQEVVVTAGSAGRAVVELAARQKADLVVAGTHGAWALGMLGSTAAAIVRQAHCDVLIVR
jgi:universal stress protein A